MSDEITIELVTAEELDITLNEDGYFTDLNDVPDDYVGYGGDLVRVNAAELGLEFYTPINEKWEMFTMTAPLLAQAYVELTQDITDNQSIRVFIDDAGIKAEQGVDYSVSSNQIFWTGYDFFTLLEVGDKLKIFYY